MSTTTTTADRPTNPPIAKVRHGNIHASIWKNYSPKGHPWYSTTVERTYKGQNGQWKPTHSFGRDELLIVAQVVTEAYEVIQSLQAQDRAERKTAQSHGNAA